MKTKLKIIIVLVLLSSCKTGKSLKPDYSESAYEPILFIKNEVEKNQNIFEVKIKNSHGGNYVLTSKVNVEKDSIRLNNNISNNFYGTQSDTTLTLYKADFLKMLNEELQEADFGIKIAGNFQDITITTSDTVKKFYTRQGLELMNLLEKGK